MSTAKQRVRFRLPQNSGLFRSELRLRPHSNERKFSNDLERMLSLFANLLNIWPFSLSGMFCGVCLQIVCVTEDQNDDRQHLETGIRRCNFLLVFYLLISDAGKLSLEEQILALWLMLLLSVHRIHGFELS